MLFATCGYENVDIHTGKGNAHTQEVKNALVTTEKDPDGVDLQ
jgi:hypothetical protein